MIDVTFAQLATTTPRNRQPLVIVEPGDYITRDGRRVTIHALELYAPAPNQPLRHEVTAFEAKGSVWRTVRGVSKPNDYSAWHLSGAYSGIGESPLDIVAPWPRKQ